MNPATRALLLVIFGGVTVIVTAFVPPTTTTIVTSFGAASSSSSVAFLQPPTAVNTGKSGPLGWFSGNNNNHGRSVSSVLSMPRRTTTTTASSSVVALFATAATMKRIPVELEDVPIPFIDTESTNNSTNASSSALKFIECYADCTAEINGVEYTIAIPCDYSVSLCYASENDPDELIPIEVTDSILMDDIFPIAESIVAEEYGEDLVLQRTPETLTLVGELELDDDEEDDDDDDDVDLDEEDDDDEEVDVLLSFEHRGKEYQLVRIKDPILLVGKKPPSTADDATAMETRLLLTKEESTEIMPTLEDMYLNYQQELDDDDDDDDEMKENMNVDETEGKNEDDDTLAMTAMDSDGTVDEMDNEEFDDDDEYEEVVAFYDPDAAQTNTLSTIDCYVDKVYEVDGVEYTIATPCDYVISICTTESEVVESEDATLDDNNNEEFNPIDIEPETTTIMNELFPLAAQAIQDEFDGEMTLTRTAQYLTLVGDLDLDAELMEGDDEEDDDDEYDDDESEIQVLLTFDKDGVEYTVVRELEPMLLVGKVPTAAEIAAMKKDAKDDIEIMDEDTMRIILDVTESDLVVPKLMEMYNDDYDDDDDEEE